MGMGLNVSSGKCVILIIINSSNAAFLHKIRIDHAINWNDAKILFRSNDYLKRRLVGSSLIGGFPNFNISEGHFKFNNILQTAILKAVRLNGIT